MPSRRWAKIVLKNTFYLFYVQSFTRLKCFFTTAEKTVEPKTELPKYYPAYGEHFKKSLVSTLQAFLNNALRWKSSRFLTAVVSWAVRNESSAK